MYKILYYQEDIVTCLDTIFAVHLFSGCHQNKLGNPIWDIDLLFWWFHAHNFCPCHCYRLHPKDVCQSMSISSLWSHVFLGGTPVSGLRSLSSLWSDVISGGGYPSPVPSPAVPPPQLWQGYTLVGTRVPLLGSGYATDCIALMVPRRMTFLYFTKV